MKTLILAACLCAMMAVTQAAETVLRCDPGWTLHSGRCFLYVSQHMKWTEAQKNCVVKKAELASVHSADENKVIQELIKTLNGKLVLTWIGGYADKQHVWFWSDGKPMKYTNWCRKQPDNHMWNQKCLQMNYGANNCWDDEFCRAFRPSVCAKNAEAKP